MELGATVVGFSGHGSNIIPGRPMNFITLMSSIQWPDGFCGAFGLL